MHIKSNAHLECVRFYAVTELQLGELVHNQKLFGLFEAMSAIEMMDPKMDAGMGCNKNPAGPLTFDTAVSVSWRNGLETVWKWFERMLSIFVIIVFV